jgi:hypothetical protein
MITLNILVGPKLGDLFHMLIVPKFLDHFCQVKTNLYIIEIHDNFSTSLEDTYNQLKPIITAQKWCNSFNIYTSDVLIDIDLNDFRINGLWGTRPYWAIFLHTALSGEPGIPRNFASIEWGKNESYSDTLVVSRAYRDFFVFNDFVKQQYLSVFEKFEKRIFLAFDEKQYDIFPLKEHVELVIVKDLSEQLEIINGSKMNLFNCSGPLCMASALNAPRIIETAKWMIPAYAFDYEFFDNVETFDSQQVFSPNPKYLNLDIIPSAV